MMGGIDTDIRGSTALDGLYAAGEVACVNINGANRLGSNSLTELLVFGARAGQSAAQFAASQPTPSAALMAQAQDEERRLKLELLDASGPERVAPLRKEMQAAMEAGAGIYRTEAGLTEAVETVKGVQERFQRIGLHDHSRTFNTELVSALELSNLLDVASTVLESARARTESRGAHQRTDHPDRNDDEFLAHSLAYRSEDGVPRVEFKPVTVTKWPPGERVYGKQTSDA
jgi:fumarate reductase flavoprotein subunit